MPVGVQPVTIAPSFDLSIPESTLTANSLTLDGAVLTSAQLTQMVSDDRIKHNEEKIVNGLEIIRLLNPLKYDKSTEAYDEDYNGEIEGSSTREAGLIAQEILKIPDLSEYVLENGGSVFKHGESEKITIYALKYNCIFTYNIAATKELDTIVQNQQNIIETQNTKIAKLEADILAIKSHLGI